MAMVISEVGLARGSLNGETIIVTGAGGGVGFEAARALLWLGANVVVAEINQELGARAQAALQAEFGAERVLFICTDVGDEASVALLHEESLRHFGRVDVVINNATIAVLGKVVDVPIEQWDASYRVNLRGPVLMARAFLPDMIQRNHGVFACVSSAGTAFLGGYESFKAAQVHLANTLDEELEGTDVCAYTIGPGLVPTETAIRAVKELAPQMGLTVDEFYAMNRGAMLSIEEAGAGFAASVFFARKFRGQEISSIQALKAADIRFGSALGEEASGRGKGDPVQAKALCEAVRVTLIEQSEGWRHRPLFERQWVLRDFKKTAGMPVEEWLEQLARLEEGLSGGGIAPVPPLEKLEAYYAHLAELAKGYEKDGAKLEENLRHVYAWQDEVTRLREII